MTRKYVDQLDMEGRLASGKYTGLTTELSRGVLTLCAIRNMERSRAQQLIRMCMEELVARHSYPYGGPYPR